MINLESNKDKLLRLEALCRDILKEKFGEILIFNNDIDQKIPGVLSIQLKGINNELFIKKFADQIAVSTGSACSSSKPSYVLQAIGKSLEELRSTIRISLSPYLSEKDLIIIKNLT